MKNTIGAALDKSYTYTAYRKIITDLLAEGKSTGENQSEALTHYSKMNQARMNRLEKTTTVSELNIQKLKLLKKDYLWLVISEGWCGDAAQLLPVFSKMEQQLDHIELKIVFRDENPELMNLFLTNGTRSIPKLIVIEKDTLEVKANWGPRPKGAIDLIRNYKEQFGVFDENGKTALQLWYLKDKGVSAQQELVGIMEAL